MNDHTTLIVRACKDCSEMFERWSKATHGGSHDCRCNPCYNRYCATRPSALARAVKQRTCADCTVVVPGRSHRCEGCRRSHRLATERERDKRRPQRPRRRWTRPCRGCGETFTRAGGSPYLCDACAPVKLGKVHGPPAPRSCADCPTLIVGNRKRCPECARLRNIERITSLYWIAASNLEIRKATAWRHQLVDYLRERDGDRCALCGDRMLFGVKTGPGREARGATIDHIVPRSLGGVDDLPNLQLACWCCNNRKGNRGGPEQLRLVG